MQKVRNGPNNALQTEGQVRCTSNKSHSGKGLGRGYIERFKTAVEKDFVLGQVCDREFNDFKDLRTAFNEWWRAYNEAPLDGFPNFGKSPSAMLRKPAA